MAGSRSKRVKILEDSPSMNTPLDGGEGSLDTVTEMPPAVEPRVEVAFDPVTLCNEVKQISAGMVALAGSVNTAMVTFSGVDKHLELQNAEMGLQDKMERVDEFIANSNLSGTGKSASKLGTQPRPGPVHVAGGGRKTKKTKTKAVSDILKNDIINLDFDHTIEDFEKLDGACKEVCTPTSSSVKSRSGTMTPWLTKSFRSVTTVQGIAGAFAREEVAQTSKKLFRSPSTASAATRSAGVSFPRSPHTPSKLYIRPAPATVVPKGCKPKFQLPSGHVWTLNESRVATYLFEDGKDPEELVLSAGRFQALRKDFDCLLPGAEISDNIITLVAVRMSAEQSYDRPDVVWCLPPTFVMDVYKGMSVEMLCRQYFSPFMTPWNTLKHIYLPIKTDSRHWYLMVISIADHLVYHFDSHLNVEDIPARNATMKTLCEILVEMMATSESYETDFFRKIVDYHSWQLIEPRGVPNTGSSDGSAVWVLSWLEMGVGFNANRSGLPDDKIVGMKTVVDLLCGEHNETRRILDDKALLFWNAHVAAQVVEVE